MSLHSVTISPRFYETDALGHINNASIAAWFEVARITFVESLGEAAAESTMHWILASLQIDFVAETFYGTDVIATITEARAGNSSLTILCEMSQGGKLTVRGTAVLVHLDAATKIPSRLPELLRQKLSEL
ncbi:MAG: thioesterase family protein [Halieaceae bacterium]|nr:thioesterase family protein [Halieaceae bacterium]